MESASLVAAAGLGLLCLVLVVVLLRGRAVSRGQLAASREETAELRARLEELSRRLEETSSAVSRVVAAEDTYVITDAGSREVEPRTVPDSVVLSATLGEPLVKVVAFGHGVRRALSAESRNRIWFEMRREVRSSRRRRRQEHKEFIREGRAAQRAAQRSAQRPDAAA